MATGPYLAWAQLVRGACDDFLRKSKARGVGVKDPLLDASVVLGDLGGIDIATVVEYVKSRMSSQPFSDELREGDEHHYCIGPFPHGTVVAVCFDERSSLGLVRLHLRRMREMLERDLALVGPV